MNPLLIALSPNFMSGLSRVTSSPAFPSSIVNSLSISECYHQHLPTSLNAKVSLLPPLVDVVTRLFSEQLLPQKEEKEKQEEDL